MSDRKNENQVKVKSYEGRACFLKKTPIKIVTVITAIILVAAAITAIVKFDSKKEGDDSADQVTTVATTKEITSAVSCESTTVLTEEETIETTKEKTTKPVVNEEKRKEENAYECDVRLYREYFGNGRYDDVLDKYEAIKEGFWKDVTICDFNNDNIYEACVRGGNVIDYFCGLLTIKNGTVQRVWLEEWGTINTYQGSVYVEHDEVKDEFVVAHYTESSPGGHIYNNGKEIYTFDGSRVSLETAFDKHTIPLRNGRYEIEEDVEEIKNKTSLYTEDKNGITYYKIDGEYVSESDYNKINVRFGHWKFENYDVEI